MSTDTTAKKESMSIEHELDESILTQFRLRLGTYHEQYVDDWVIGGSNNVAIAVPSQQTFAESNIDGWNMPVESVDYIERDGAKDEFHYVASYQRYVITASIIKQIAAFMDCTVEDVHDNVLLHEAPNMPILITADEYLLIVAPRL